MQTQGSDDGPGAAQTSRCDHYECQACSATFQTRQIKQSSNVAIWTLGIPAAFAVQRDPAPLQPV